MKKLMAFIFLGIFMSGCATTTQRALSGGDQVKLRSIESRSFDTNDVNYVTRNVVATMQDLGFVIDNADADLGTVTGTKLNGYEIKMTVSIRQVTKKRIVVRASARYNTTEIEDPKTYQDFFTSLGKAMFLSANKVE
jgi:hypothetical protein